MQVQYLKQNSLDYLKSNISTHHDQYENNEPWLDTLLKDHFSLPSNLFVGDIQLKIPKSSREHYDLENTIKLYEAFKNLDLVQASDERIWVYLTHITFWEYMRQRWPVEENTSTSTIKQRYFFSSGNKDRALVRNGISRLWWYGYVTYDENRDDKFELTRTLLSTTDITQNLMERQFSRNKTITQSVLSALSKHIKDNGIPSRNIFRNLMKYINYISGVTIVDALDEKEIGKLVLNKLEKERLVEV